MGQFLQERRAQQLPWHQRVWAGLDHPAHKGVLAHGCNWRERPGFGAQEPFSRCLFPGENPDGQDVSGHGLTQHSRASPAQRPPWSPFLWDDKHCI